ncbi:MAG TPA: winged helix-turn-helix transcriptional regulator [Anaerolineaceae bacterium]|jgi:DNA-binding MarR family transcriptional regulator
MELQPESERDLILLEEIEQNPDATQATLASQLGVAVGTVNWHLKRLIAKGYVKVRRAERRKLRYIITPEGLTLRANLTINYIHNSFRVYRLVRERSLLALAQIRQAGYHRVQIQGEGDVAEVCRLTCLEQGISVEVANTDHLPCLEVRGMKVILHMEGEPKPQ